MAAVVRLYNALVAGQLRLVARGAAISKSVADRQQCATQAAANSQPRLCCIRLNEMVTIVGRHNLNKHAAAQGRLTAHNMHTLVDLTKTTWLKVCCACYMSAHTGCMDTHT